MSTGLVILSFILGIIIMLLLITIHELGHFIVAKLSKAYVYEFSIGFGPRLLTFKRKETWVSIRAFPLGGYCSIASDKSDPPKGREDEVVPFERKMDYIVRWKKALFILAGPLMNLIIAICIITLTFSIAGYKKNDMSWYGANYDDTKIANKLIKDYSKSHETDLSKYEYDNLSRYAIYGWQIENINPTTKEKSLIFDNVKWENKKPLNEDAIINDLNSNAVDFKKTVYTFLGHLKDHTKDTDTENVHIRFAVRFIDMYSWKPIEIKSNTKDYTQYFTKWNDEIKDDEYKFGENVGIAAPTHYYKNSTEAYGEGWKEVFTQSVSILKSFGSIITGHFSQIAGPVGVAKQTSAMLSDPVQFLLYIGVLSANLFILNMVFIPPLDGWRFIENIIEACMRKELNGKLKIWLYSIGAISFLLLFVGITIKDIFM